VRVNKSLYSLALAFLVAAGCSGPESADVDAAADAAADGDASTDGHATDGTPGPPGPLDGEWAVTWTCLESCLSEPEILRTQRLTVASGSLHWYSPTCGECVVDHVGSQRGDCLDVPAGLDNAIDDRDAYAICTTGPSTLQATIAVRRVGGVPVAGRWRVDGVRR
jgi:hypothetical protein